MIRHPLRPHLSFDDESELLRAMDRARTPADGFGGSIGTRSPHHRLTHELQNAVDALATGLTGRQRFSMGPRGRHGDST